MRYPNPIDFVKKYDKIGTLLYFRKHDYCNITGVPSAYMVTIQDGELCVMKPEQNMGIAK